MLFLFLILITTHRFSPEHLFRWITYTLRPAADWIIPNMGVFFTSSFILIPQRAPVSAGEVGLICALFLPSFLATWIGTVLVCKLVTRFSSTKEIQSAVVETQPDASKFEKSSADQVVIPINGVSLHNTLAHSQNPSISTSTSSPDNSLIQENLEKGSVFNESMNASDDTRKFSITEDSRSVSDASDNMMTRRLALWFDPMVFFTLFLIGLPLFYIPGSRSRSLPLFISTLALAWLLSTRAVPRAWKKVFHPILVTSFLTVCSLWGLGAIRGNKLTETLSQFSSGTTYFVILRRGREIDIPHPGAGDVLTSILVAGIVSLAFPLFQYRRDLYDNFLKMLLVTIPNCVVSALLWPFIAHAIGISPEKGPAFAGRFLSTPFGIEFLRATGGDLSLVVVLICVTGILAVLVKDPLFRLLRVRQTVGSDDYFTIGATIGCIAGAIGTSSLVNSHPRAAATATVTFVLYGVILLGLVAVPNIAQFVAILAGLSTLK